MKILFIEEDEHVRKSIEQAFKKDGSEVVTCKTALKAISRLGMEDFDFVLIDLKLKHYDGRQVAKQIKKLGIPYGFYSGLDIPDKQKKQFEVPVFCKGQSVAVLVGQITG